MWNLLYSGLYLGPFSLGLHQRNAGVVALVGDQVSLVLAIEIHDGDGPHCVGNIKLALLLVARDTDCLRAEDSKLASAM